MRITVARPASFALFIILIVSVEVRPQVASQTIEGVVKETGTENPIPNVKVYTDSALGPASDAVTDAEGRFALMNVGSGPQRILTEKAGYSPARPDGRKLPGNPGIWLTAPIGKTLGGVVIHLIPVGGISGRIVDRLGQPVARVEVYAAQFAYDIYGEHHLEAASKIGNIRNAVTNERGEFRINGLDAATYYVVVQPPLSVSCPIPGEAFLPAGFYPAATNVSNAETISVEPGSTYRLPPITLHSVPAGALEIRMIDPSGKTHPDSLKFVALHRSGDEGQSFALGMKAEGYGGADRVALGLRAPGSYDIQVGWLTSSGLAQLLTRTTISLPRAGLSLDLPIAPGPNINGGVELEQADGTLSSVSGVRFEFIPKWGGGLPVKTASDPNGTFAAGNVPSGTYAVAIGPLPENTYIQRLDSTGSQAASDHIVVGTEDMRLTLRLGNAGGTIDGHVKVSGNGNPAGATVVVVPDAPLRENGFLYRTTVSDQDGYFRFKAVAPGSYLVFAWSELEGAAYRNGAFIGKYERSGVPLMVKKNNRETVNVSLAN